MAWSRTSSPGKRAFETSTRWTRSVRTSGAFTRIVAVRALRAILSLSLFAQLLLPATALPTFASSVSSASFTGGAGTATVGGTLYAKSGGALTLTVTTSNDTKCVEVSGAHAARQTSSTAKSSWTFSFTAGTGDGAQAVTAAASPNFNANNCTGQTGSAQAPYMLDNTGPTVTAVLSPAPNAAGWNQGNVSITWTASDGSGSGVASGPSPATDSQSANTIGTTKTSTATDRLGNTGTGSVTVKVDKMNPTITGSRTPAANANGWNNTDVTVSFSCNDSVSGIQSCSSPTTLSSSGANQSVAGTAVDNADNSGSASVSGINIDKVAPTLSGAPTTSPNAAGWYNGNVTIHWTASDALSGLAGSAPADSTISGEGSGLTASASVSDKAGNTTTATSSPAVKIDKTAPTTNATAPANWNNTNVTVSLNATDALSGVANTVYTLDGGAQQSGSSVAISSEGDHALAFWSVDNAGNTETAKSVHVKIDKTPPTINHTQSPVANASGWNNSNVTVTFVCADGLSGLASCTSPQAVTTEGANQTITGTAFDNAGNSATDPANVNIDKTAPTISAAADRAANANGWYHADVIVTFTCGDTLSGIATCPAAHTLGEGANQSVNDTATDAAGNSTSAGVSSINIDKTEPSLSGAAATGPNANGWHNGDVSVHWTASDGLSGLDGLAPADSTITGEGNNLSANASVSDLAGNSKSATISGIMIDRNAPSTSASVPDPLASGWYAGQVQVNLTGVDSLSGVAATYYNVDGGAAQTYSGPFNHDSKGIHTITFWSVDKAGNTEDATVAGHSLTLKLDDVKPSTGAASVPAVADGSNNFYKTSVDVTLTAADAESGVAATFYSIDAGAPHPYAGTFTLGLDGTHTVTYWSVDNAGNVEDATAKGNVLNFAIDLTPPTIVEKSRTPAANTHGWNNSDVTVSFTCTDDTSGPASCADLTFSNEGANQQANASATDNAGNTSTPLLVSGVNIDKTNPTLAGAATTNPNAFGWYNGNVSIHWTGQDGLSGLDPATQPADSVITGQGSSLGAGPVTIADNSGNSGSASVSGIKIDRTPPTISGATVNDDGTPRSASASGWYNSAVRVRFICGDALSGVQECASDVVLNSDGANLSANGTATDRADNSASATKSGINIDSQAPMTDADLQCTSKNGYCRGNQATVVLTATDQPGLSGVKEIHHSSNNGASWQVSTGATASLSLNLTGSGKAKVLFYAVDNAGNPETQDGVEVKYDTIAPTVTHVLNPAANAAGWNKVNTTVHFDAADDSDGSGVDLPTVTSDQTISTETAGQVVNGSAYDLAGNKGTDSVNVKLDKTAPTISGAPTTSPNASGWYTSAVTVHFTCGDQSAVQSGIATCPADDVLSTDGANLSSTGTAVDKAGNTASVTIGGIKIDSLKPVMTGISLTNGAVYTLGDVAIPSGTPTCTATDGGSGVASCSVALTGGKPNGVGTFNFTATAKDVAGNTTTQSGSYKVIYRFDGFLQPINDTAHQIDQATSIFKGGSTVPAKLQLKKADGTVAQANTDPQWLTPLKGSATSAPVDETVYSDTATSGATYRWDSTAQQYIYNWSTKGTATGYYYRVGVTLDDGQTYYVNIGLR